MIAHINRQRLLAFTYSNDYVMVVHGNLVGEVKRYRGELAYCVSHLGRLVEAYKVYDYERGRPEATKNAIARDLEFSYKYYTTKPYAKPDDSLRQ